MRRGQKLARRRSKKTTMSTKNTTMTMPRTTSTTAKLMTSMTLAGEEAMKAVAVRALCLNSYMSCSLPSLIA